jgi:hypothetical protein
MNVRELIKLLQDCPDQDATVLIGEGLPPASSGDASPSTPTIPTSQYLDNNRALRSFEPLSQPVPALG